MVKFFKFFIILIFFCTSVWVFDTAVFADTDIDFEEIIIKSFDDSDIKILFKQSRIKQEPVFVFINDYRDKKEKWDRLVTQIDKKRFSVVEYDLREFFVFERGDRRLDNNDYEYRPAYFLQDLDKLLLFLDIDYGIKNNQVVLIGAGLGANIALKYAAGNNAIKSVILLSPKKEVKRISTKASIRNYGDRPIMFLTSMNDKESYDTCLDYMSYLSSNKNVRIKFYYFDQDKKPMDFLQEKIVVDDIIDWINKYYK